MWSLLCCTKNPGRGAERGDYQKFKAIYKRTMIKDVMDKQERIRVNLKSSQSEERSERLKKMRMPKSAYNNLTRSRLVPVCSYFTFRTTAISNRVEMGKMRVKEYLWPRLLPLAQMRLWRSDRAFNFQTRNCRTLLKTGPTWKQLVVETDTNDVHHGCYT